MDLGPVNIDVLVTYLGGWVHAIEKPNPELPCLVRRLVVVKGVRPPLLPIPGPRAGPVPRPGPESPVGSSSRCLRKLLSSFVVSNKIYIYVYCRYKVFQGVSEPSVVTCR